MPSDAELLELATQARGRAVADVSNYRVGACLRTDEGRAYTGCNLENIVLAETVCAEKVALFKALEAGERDFETMAVSTISSPPASPCGSCRQMLHHWGFRRVISTNDQGETVEWTLTDLLPAAFEI